MTTVSRASTASALRRTRPAAPARIVHLGLGAFSRSHTAWYTQSSADAADWGIVAYTGRSRDLSDRLTSQDGLYTLIVRGEQSDRAEVIESVVRTHAGDDLEALTRDLASAHTSIVTLTITEIGYRLRPDGEPDDDDPQVRRDRAELAEIASGRLDLAQARPETAPGRLLLGLEARRRAGGERLAILSCDNLPDNGGRLRRGLMRWSENAAPELHRWIDERVSFVSSSVDRITPRISPLDEKMLREDHRDLAPVVAEPFRDWVISGDFPAGRPAWESAGARFVDDLGPWETRKLWLLNGAHTLLACLGLLRGHDTVASAIADPVCRSAVENFWDDAAGALPEGIEVVDYRSALLNRFANPRIEHQLSQIAQDTETKVGLRLAPVAEQERARGREAWGSAFALAAWIVAHEAGLVPGSAARDADAAAQKLSAVSTSLAEDTAFVALVEEARVAMTAECLPESPHDSGEIR